MIARDRHVLALLGRLNARLDKLNRGIAETMNLLLHNLDDGMLPSGGIRTLAEHFDEFAPEFRNLAAELRATADANETDASTPPPDSPAGRAMRGIQERPGMGPEENSGWVY